MSESVLIVGAGQGLSESLARLCVSKNIKVVLGAKFNSFFDIKARFNTNLAYVFEFLPKF